MTQYTTPLTWNAMISSALDVEWRKIFAESVWSILGEQMLRHLLGNELVGARQTSADQTQHHHVDSIVRLFVHQVRVEELLKQTLQSLGKQQQQLHPFDGPLSETTRVRWYQKGKTNLDLITKAKDTEWQWNQLGHTQVCTSPQTDSHASTPPLNCSLQPGCPFCPQLAASKHWRYTLKWAVLDMHGSYLCILVYC